MKFNNTCSLMCKFCTMSTCRFYMYVYNFSHRLWPLCCVSYLKIHNRRCLWFFLFNIYTRPSLMMHSMFEIQNRFNHNSPVLTVHRGLTMKMYLFFLMRRHCTNIILLILIDENCFAIASTANCLRTVRTAFCTHQIVQ